MLDVVSQQLHAVEYNGILYFQKLNMKIKKTSYVYGKNILKLYMISLGISSIYFPLFRIKRVSSISKA
jgi:hypothetical protein